MMDVTYENFIKLLSENPTVEKIREKDINVKRSLAKIKNGNKVYIWPSARMGKSVYKELKGNGYTNLFLVDKNEDIEDVISPEKVVFTSDDVLIIATLNYSNEIYHLAKKMGCNNIIMYYSVKALGEISHILFPEVFYDRCIEGLPTHLLENTDRYKEMYFSLEDDISKKAFLNNMFFRLTDDIRYTFECDEGMQYFDSSIIEFNSEDVLVDAGGYHGDTLEQFLSLNKPFKSYYLFEPDKDLIEQAKMITKDKRVFYINKGLSSKPCTLMFNKTEAWAGGGRIIEAGTEIIDKNRVKIETIEATSIDTFMNDKISFIKMDIEGSEFEALKGAENSIKKYTPTLAISIYHKATDYLDIFEYIKGLYSNYKFFLRQHTNFYADNVLYAVSGREKNV